MTGSVRGAIESNVWARRSRQPAPSPCYPSGTLSFPLVILRHDRRQILWLGVTAHPSDEWIARQLTEACGWECTPPASGERRKRLVGSPIRGDAATEQGDDGAPVMIFVRTFMLMNSLDTATSNNNGAACATVKRLLACDELVNAIRSISSRPNASISRSNGDYFRAFAF
jgi:hypothetical protein